VINGLSQTITCPLPAGESFAGTVTNHALLPNPAYGASLLVDAGASIMPFVNESVPVPLELIGGSTASLLGVYQGLLRFTEGGQGEIVADGSDFGFTGTAYQVLDAVGTRGGSINFQNVSYLGRRGVGDWGFGADFQNSGFAAAAEAELLTHAVAPAPVDSTHKCLLNYQKHLAHPYGYLPATHANACSGAAADRNVANWQWDPLAASCDDGGLYYSVSFFGARATDTINEQINSHLFLNSFKALNHVVALLLAHPGLWPTTPIF
jgi:hypothetical protein